MAVLRKPIDINETNMVLRVTGAFLSAFSLVMGLVTLFAPTKCTFLGSLQLLIFGFLFICGLVIFLIGLIMPAKVR